MAGDGVSDGWDGQRGRSWLEGGWCGGGGRAAASVRTVCLPPGWVRRVRLRAGEGLWVREGRVWMTREGDPVDHVLTAGQVRVAERAEVWVLQSCAVGASLCERLTPLRHVTSSRFSMARLWSSLRAMSR